MPGSIASLEGRHITLEPMHFSASSLDCFFNCQYHVTIPIQALEITQKP